MLERPLSHQIHTNIGGAGYRMVESPEGWPRGHSEEVGTWLQSLRPQPKAATSYAASCFKLGRRMWSAVAVLHSRFGTDQHVRQGVLAHALLVPVSPEDGDAAHQVALVQVARSIEQQVEQYRGTDAASQLVSYRGFCRRRRRLHVKSATLEPLRSAVDDTLPWLLRAVEIAPGEPVAIPQTPDAELHLPLRLAHAVSALPPRLGLTATWGCWLLPHQDLRLVVDRVEPDLQAPSLPPSMVEYVNWLRARLRQQHGHPAALAAVLSDWRINDWQTLGHQTTASSRGAHRSTSGPVDIESQSEGPDLQRGSMQRSSPRQPRKTAPADPAADSRQMDSRSRRRPAEKEGFTPDAEFFQAQLDAMRRELDRSLTRRFELLEKSLGVPVGSSRPGSPSPSPSRHWLRRAERPVLYSLVLLALGLSAWQWRRSLQPPGARLPPAELAAADSADPAALGASGRTRGPGREEAAGGDRLAVAGAQDGGQEPAGFRGTWQATWNALATEDRPLLAVWLRKIAALDGVRESQVSQGQRTRFAGFVDELQAGSALDANALDLSRQALFEYAVARWVDEKKRSETITINLGFQDMTQDLIDQLVADLDPKPRPEPQQASSPELQAAVVCTWIRLRSGT